MIHDIHQLYGGAALVMIAAAFAFGLGPIFIWKGVASLLRAQRAKRWPKAAGVIVRSEVDVTDLYEGLPDSEPEISRYPIVEYAYEVGGRKYQSRRFYLEGGIPNVEADEMVARYPMGAAVAVFHNPTDPADCALDVSFRKGYLRRSILMILAVIPFELVSIFALKFAVFYMLALLDRISAPSM
jgi:hypothetical protein